MRHDPAQAAAYSVAPQSNDTHAETVGLHQPYDYIGVNDALRNGRAVMVSPFLFNRSMDDEPWRGLAGYIRDVKKVRDQLLDYAFTGERLDAGEAKLDPDRPPAGATS